MPQNLFLQNVIAIIWDFDQTLIPGYMQEPLFTHYDVKSEEFWAEVKKMRDQLKRQGDKENVRASPDIVPLNHILTYVRTGKFAGLNNALLREFGEKIQFYPGLPEFFPAVANHIEKTAISRKHEISVEHYVVSTGLRQMILGSPIAHHVRDVWGCEFVEAPAQQEMDIPASARRAVGATRQKPKAKPTPTVIAELGYFIDDTTKTRAVFEINKGCNVDVGIDVNAAVRPQDRRVPFQNMIYIADGPSDVPVFSVINRFGGKTFAVYTPRSCEHFAQVRELQDQGRVQSFGEADYTEGSQTYMWIVDSAQKIANRISDDRRRALEEKVVPPPRHIDDGRPPVGALDVYPWEPGQRRE